MANRFAAGITCQTNRRMALVPTVALIWKWFVIQLFSEIGAVTQDQSGGVTYMTHMGGFIFGPAVVRLFETCFQQIEPGVER